MRFHWSRSKPQNLLGGPSVTFMVFGFSFFLDFFILIQMFSQDVSRGRVLLGKGRALVGCPFPRIGFFSHLLLALECLATFVFHNQYASSHSAHLTTWLLLPLMFQFIGWGFVLFCFIVVILVLFGCLEVVCFCNSRVLTLSFLHVR